MESRKIGTDESASIFKSQVRECPGGPVVRTFTASVLGFSPGRGSKICKLQCGTAKRKGVAEGGFFQAGNGKLGDGLEKSNLPVSLPQQKSPSDPGS